MTVMIKQIDKNPYIRFCLLIYVYAKTIPLRYSVHANGTLIGACLLNNANILINTLYFHSNQYSIIERPLREHHSTICCRLESDRNNVGFTLWRTKEYRS